MMLFKRWIITLVFFLCAVCGVEAAMDYQVKSSIVYVEKTDTLRFLLWLEYRGILVTDQSRASNILGSAEVYVSDVTSGGWMDPLVIATPAVNGIYGLDIPDVTTTGTPKLQRGATYFARCLIHYGGTSGTDNTYQTVTTFTVTLSQSLVVVTNQIAETNTNIQTQVQGVKPLISSEANSDRQSVNEVKDQAQQIVTATTTTLPEQIRTRTGAVKTQVETAAKSQILNRETTALQGSTVNIRFRTYENAAPVIAVYGPKNEVLISHAPMKSVAAGIYEYPVSFSTDWPLGDYTIACSEPIYGAMDAITITVVFSDLASVSSDVSAILGSVQSSGDLKNKIEAFMAALGMIEENIQRTSKALAGTRGDSEAAASVAEQVTSLYNSLKDMSANIEALGGVAGFDVRKLYTIDAAYAKDLGYLRNKAQELKALLLLDKQLMSDTAKEEALIQTWMVFR